MKKRPQLIIRVSGEEFQKNWIKRHFRKKHQKSRGVVHWNIFYFGVRSV